MEFEAYCYYCKQLGYWSQFSCESIPKICIYCNKEWEVKQLNNMKTPKSARECQALLEANQAKQNELRQKQIELAKEVAPLVALDENILTEENFKALTSLVSLGGKGVIPDLMAAVKNNPSKEGVKRAGKISVYCTLYDWVLNWFNDKLKEDV